MRVCAVLVELDRYQEWNPHIRRAHGVVTVGKKVTLRMHPPKGRAVTIRPRVTFAEPGVELRLVGRVPGLFSGEHRFVLRPSGQGTHLEQSETYRGPIVAFLSGAIRASRTSFETSNRALKDRAEAT
jgi:hypothetical protein